MFKVEGKGSSQILASQNVYPTADGISGNADH
jgi:hypothetical protein